MSILTQKTISKKISLKGVGIHTGKKVNLNDLVNRMNETRKQERKSNMEFSNWS